MKIIKNIAIAMAMIGVCGIPGCIEFGGWAQCIALIILGSAGYIIIEREFYEDKEVDSRSHHRNASRPKYLR